MKVSRDRRIDFIIIGAQKAGTTALFDHLSDDPSLSLSKVKEVHFFDSEAVNWEAPDYGLYHDQFDWSDQRIRGEATSIYVYWPGSMERIAAYRPDIKVILLLCDPVERTWSHWRIAFSQGAETLPFGEAIRRGRQRLFAAEPWGHHREFSYVEQGFFAAQLERLLGLFHREQLLILEADELQADPGKALTRFNAFVGAPLPSGTAPRQEHLDKDLGQMDAADRAWLEGVFAADQARLAAMLDPEV